MSDLQTYLASKYLTGPKADAILARAGEDVKRRKKKRKVEAGAGVIVAREGGLIIADDDGMVWGANKEEEDEDSRPVVEERRGHFKAKSANSWATVRPADPSLAPSPSPEREDEKPVLVASTSDLGPPSRGGLQSSADLRAENARRQAEQDAKKAQAAKELAIRKKEMRERGEEEDDPTQTVYRDSSGRKIDIKKEKAAKAQARRAELEEEMKKMEWGKGLVQREDQEKKKKELIEMRNKPLARYADDKDMNDELKDRERWNDPGAAFLTKEKKKSKTVEPKFPRYNGPAPPPNRFGIPPGYRWDGVIRGNGFEATFMQRGNSVKMRTAEAHAYNTEDM